MQTLNRGRWMAVARLGLPGSAAHLESGIEAGCLLLADNVEPSCG